MHPHVCLLVVPPPLVLQPLHPELLLSEARARQVVQQYALHYNLSGQVCRQLGVHPRLLGRLTGNIWVNDSSGERVDIGLAVKNAKQGLCVPGEAQGQCCSLCNLLVVQERIFFVNQCSMHELAAS